MSRVNFSKARSAKGQKWEEVNFAKCEMRERERERERARARERERERDRESERERQVN